MDFLKLLPILFIAHQPSSLVETRFIDQNRQLSSTYDIQPEYVPVYIAMGNSPPDVGALEAFYKREVPAVDKGKNEEESSITTTAVIDANSDKSESSTTVKVTELVETDKEKQTKEEPVKNESTTENADSSTESSTESMKQETAPRVVQYEVTEEQQE